MGGDTGRRKWNCRDRASRASTEPRRGGGRSTPEPGLCLGAQSLSCSFLPPPSPPPTPSGCFIAIHFTDEETEAGGAAVRSQEPPFPAPSPQEGPQPGGGARPEPAGTARPALGQGGWPSGNGSLRSQAPPSSRSGCWLCAHPPHTLPIELLSLPGRAPGPYIPRRRRGQPARRVGWAGGAGRTGPRAGPGCGCLGAAGGISGTVSCLGTGDGVGAAEPGRGGPPFKVPKPTAEQPPPAGRRRRRSEARGDLAEGECRSG